MKEIIRILAEIERRKNENFRFALATVVHVIGSSYRKPGARMLIGEDGSSLGAISGGCLEDDLIRKSKLIIDKGENRLICYETSDEAGSGLKLGCNGTIFILVEPLWTKRGSLVLHVLKNASQSKSNGIVSIFFDLNVLHNTHLGTSEFISNQENEKQTVGIFEEAFRSRKNIIYTSIEKDGVLQSTFINYIKPVISLIVFGSGYDVLPLVQLARTLGWNYSIFNKRPHFPEHKQFQVQGLSELKVLPQLLNKYALNRSAFILMSHNYDYDKAVLSALSELNTSYVGMLGPMSKRSRMRTELYEEGKVQDDAFWKNLHSPVGLDIGANDAEEIALAIIAEIQAHFSSQTTPHFEHSNHHSGSR